MAKYKLAISIPTYERPECISELIDYMIDEAEQLNVGIYVFDGSEKNDAENMCKKYEKYRCFNYIRHSGTIAKRHCEAIYKPDCEYLWFCRDRSILKIEFWSLVIKLLDEKLDILLLGALDNPEQDHVKYYCNPQELMNDFFCSMVYFGSYIIKKSFLINIDYTVDNYMESFPLLSRFFHSASERSNFKALYVPFGVLNGYIHIHTELSSPHLYGKNFTHTWAKNWVEMIDDLPKIYNPDKENLKMLRNRDIWGFYNILTMFRKKTLNLNDLQEYKTYIKQVTKTPWYVIVFMSHLPCWVLHIIREITRPIYRYNKEKFIKKLKKQNR